MSSEKYDDKTLLAFIRGGLDEELAVQIAQASENDRELAAEIALLRAVRDCQANLEDEAPGDIGWARLSRDIDAAQAGPPPQHAAPWRARRFSIWQVAACAAVCVVAWQAIAVPRLTPAADEARYVPASRADGQAQNVRVLFHEDAREGEFRALLQRIDAELVSGPSAIGFYTLTFDGPDARRAGIEALEQAGPLVETVQVD